MPAAPASPESPADLATIPLFPLNTVLFPGAVLPLRIFEVRYLDMVGRAHREGTPFGVVCLREGPEVQQPSPAAASGEAAVPFAAERFAEVGTLARITHLERPQAGLMVIRCEATQRFRLNSSHRLPHGLWMGEATLLPADADVEVPEDLHAVREMLRGLIRSVEAQISDPVQRPFMHPYRLDDCGWLANTWCSLLPVDTRWKQRLLETDSPLLRLELVSDLLERIRPGAS